MGPNYSYITIEANYFRLTTARIVIGFRRCLVWSLVSGLVVPLIVAVVSSYWFSLEISV